MPVAVLWFALFGGFAVLHAVISWRAYARWRRVRFERKAAASTNLALLRAVESNGKDWSQKDWDYSHALTRLFWTNEHRRIGDPKLSRLVHAMRAMALLFLAVWASIFIGVAGLAWMAGGFSG